MSKEWYVELEGKQEGPFSTDKVNAFVKKGKLKVDNLIWCDGMSDWQPVKIIPEFKSLLYESKMDEFAPVDEKAVSPQPVMRQKSQVSPVSYTAKKVVADEGVATAKKGGSVMAVAGLVLIVLSIVAIGGVALWFRKELTETKATLSSYKTELDDSKKTISSQKAEIGKLNSRIDRASDVFDNFKSQLADTKGEIDKVNSRFDKANEIFNKIDSQLDKTNEVFSDFKSQIAEMKTKIIDFKWGMEDMKQKVDKANSRLDKASEILDGLKSELGELKDKVSSMKTSKSVEGDKGEAVKQPDSMEPKLDIEQGLSAQQYFDKAEEFYGKQDWANAIRYYSKALQIRSDWAIVYSNRGMARYNIGDYKNAEDDFGIAGTLDQSRKAQCDYMIAKCKAGLNK